MRISKTGRRALGVFVAALMVSTMAACGSSGSAGGSSGKDSSSNDSGSSGSAASSDKVQVLNVGLDVYGIASQVYAAQVGGFFKKHNLKVNISTFATGADDLAAALTGQTDIGYAADYGSLAPLASGKLKYLASLTRSAPSGFTVLAVRSGINSADDLKGKVIGISPGTNESYVSDTYLKQHNIPKSAVTYQNYSDPASMGTALLTGKIDAAWVYSKAVQEVQKDPSIKILAKDSDVIKQDLNLVLATTDVLKNRPEAVNAFIAALVDAQKWMDASKANQTTTIKYIAKEIKTTVADATTTFKNVPPAIGLRNSDYELLLSMAKFLVAQKNAKLTEKDIKNFKDYFDPGPLKAADPSLVDLS